MPRRHFLFSWRTASPRPRPLRTACVKSSKRRAAGDRIAPFEYMGRWWTFSGRTVSRRRLFVLKRSGINWQIRRRFRFYVATRWVSSTRTRISKRSVATTHMLFQQMGKCLLLLEPCAHAPRWCARRQRLLLTRPPTGRDDAPAHCGKGTKRPYFLTTDLTTDNRLSVKICY